MKRNPDTVPDDDILDALLACHHSDDYARDRLGGGYTADEVADVHGCSRGTALTHLRNLRSDGRAESFHGVPPEGTRPRLSFLPAEVVDDAPAPDEKPRSREWVA